MNNFLLMSNNNSVNNFILGRKIKDMRVSWIKSSSDNKKFRIPELLGFDVFSLQDNEDIDKKIDELIGKHYNTIVISKDLAGFSQKINSEYINNKNINIIIDNKEQTMHF